MVITYELLINESRLREKWFGICITIITYYYNYDYDYYISNSNSSISNNNYMYSFQPIYTIGNWKWL